MLHRWPDPKGDGMLPKPKREPKVFDMMSYQLAWSPKDGGLHGWCCGFSHHDIRKGDFLIMHERGSGRSARYRVVEFRRPTDPGDQWFADLEFDPRAKEKE